MKAKKIWFENEAIYVEFDSGHIIANPLSWFEWLRKATQKERGTYTLEPFGIWWDALNEGLSYEGLFSYQNTLLDLWKQPKQNKGAVGALKPLAKRKNKSLQKVSA